MLLNRRDVRLGVSIFGSLTTFISAEDVISLGFQYQKGLGVIAAVFISVFIGQEYQWSTWQHKWLIGKNRFGMYLSKAFFSGAASLLIFLSYELSALLFSGQIGTLLTGSFAASMLCGALVYIALGSVICFVSMVIRSSTVSAVAALGCVLLSETLITTLQSIRSKAAILEEIAAWIVKHSIYSISSALSSAAITPELIKTAVTTSLATFALLTIMGMMIFNRYEV